MKPPDSNSSIIAHAIYAMGKLAPLLVEGKVADTEDRICKAYQALGYIVTSHDAITLDKAGWHKPGKAGARPNDS